MKRGRRFQAHPPKGLWTWWQWSMRLRYEVWSHTSCNKSSSSSTEKENDMKEWEKEKRRRLGSSWRACFWRRGGLVLVGVAGKGNCYRKTRILVFETLIPLCGANVRPWEGESIGVVFFSCWAADQWKPYFCTPLNSFYPTHAIAQKRAWVWQFQNPSFESCILRINFSVPKTTNNYFFLLFLVGFSFGY